MSDHADDPSFEITWVDFGANRVVVEDRELGLRYEFNGSGDRIKDARIENDYVLVLGYEDGTSSTSVILES